jgi:hypothetical protein
MLRGSPHLRPAREWIVLIAILSATKVEKVGEAADWAQIRVKRDGTIGWVASRFLSPTPVAAPPAGASPSIPSEQVTPPPLPEIREPMKPTPAKPPAVERPKPALPEEVPAVPTPAIKKKPEEITPVRPARPAPPAVEESEEVEEPKPVRPAKKPAPLHRRRKPRLRKNRASSEPAPEKPSGIRIM